MEILVLLAPCVCVCVCVSPCVSVCVCVERDGLLGLSLQDVEGQLLLHLPLEMENVFFVGLIFLSSPEETFILKIRKKIPYTQSLTSTLAQIQPKCIILGYPLGPAASPPGR